MNRALLAVLAGLSGCTNITAGDTSTTTTSTDVVTVAAAFLCGFTDVVIGAAFPDLRFTAPGTTSALIGWPASYTGELGEAFADGC